MTNDSNSISLVTIETLCANREVSTKRQESLALAIAAGAPLSVLETLRDANRLAKSLTVVLPALRYESLSRGRGWARKGRGTAVTWGEHVEDGYQVGPGSWEVGATDGFSRKDKRTWTVKHVRVGDQTWTIAN
jgi:hypothetical protein